MSAPTARPDRKEFRRVRKEDDPAEKAARAENEIKVAAGGRQNATITYAIALLNGEDGKTKQDTIKITGMGAAIYNAVNVAEILKRRVKGLSQTTDISSQVVQDSYEAVEAGKAGMEVDRKVSVITITLSTKPLDTKHIGYQAPLPEDQVTEQEDRKPGETIRREGRGRGEGRRRGGRGGRGGEPREPREAREPREPREAREGDEAGRGRGSGRGRGRGGDGEGAVRGGRGSGERREGGRGGERGRGSGERREGGRGSGERGAGRGGERGAGRGGERGGRGSGERRDERRDDRRDDRREGGRGGAGERGAARGSGERGAARGSGERGAGRGAARGSGERGSGERGAGAPRGAGRGRN
jgi:DNA-binding protein